MGKSQKIQYVNIIIITLKRGMVFYLNMYHLHPKMGFVIAL